VKLRFFDKHQAGFSETISSLLLLVDAFACRR